MQNTSKYIILAIGIVIIITIVIMCSYPKSKSDQSSTIPISTDDIDYDIDFESINYKIFDNIIKNIGSNIGLSDERGNILETKCSAPLDNKILDGHKIGLFAHPWLALLNYEFVTPDGKTQEYQCGGVLINARYVLTAAHCLPDFSNTNVSLVSVLLGEHDLTEPIETEDGFTADPPQELLIEEMIIHPKYDETNNNKEYDIGLIRLAKNANTTVDTVRPMCLAQNLSAMKPTEKYIVEGYGYTVSKNAYSTPNVPLRLFLPQFDQNECQKIFGRNITSNQFCAGGEKGKDACTQDSGNPVFIIRDGNFYAVGIVSYGSSDCGTVGVPGVYTNIPPLIDWIMSAIRS